MDRQVAAQYPIHPLLAGRFSPLAFAERFVEPEKLHSLLEAARWAPSSNNAQPWSFLVATRDQADEHAKLVACLAEKNQIWARTAPVLLLSVATLVFESTGKPNRHAFHDVGLASALLTVEARALDLYTHFMAGFSVDQARASFEIPSACEPVAAIALGYLGDPQGLPPDMQKRQATPTSRKPQVDFVFTGRWGEPR